MSWSFDREWIQHTAEPLQLHLLVSGKKCELYFERVRRPEQSNALSSISVSLLFLKRLLFREGKTSGFVLQLSDISFV